MKVSKASVHYRPANLGIRRCDACCMFDPPDECTHVEGRIVPAYTCNDWKVTPPRIYVIRHGSTADNRGGPGADRLRGHTNVSMDARGIREVNKSADLLASVPIEVMYSSDLDRAKKTAEIIDHKQGDSPRVIFAKELRTWDLGYTLEEKIETPALLAKVKSYIVSDDKIPPGGESFSDYVTRVLKYISPLFDRMKSGNGRIIALVSHGRTAQVLDYWIAAGCDEKCMHRDFVNNLAVEPNVLHPGGVACYEWNGRRWIGTEIPENVQTPGTKIASRHATA